MFSNVIKGSLLSNITVTKHHFKGFHYVVHIEQKCVLHICLFHNPPVGRCRCWGQRSACAVCTTHYWPQWGVLGEPLWPPPHSRAPQRLNAVLLNSLLKNTQKIHIKYLKNVLQYCLVHVGQRLSAQQPTCLYFFPPQTRSVLGEKSVTEPKPQVVAEEVCTLALR